MVTVAENDPANCALCGSAKIEQDPDVLDTWFSSGLWPFTALGWPDDTPDFRKYYPTTLMIMGYDILFFWAARMIMMGLHFTGQVPFRRVFLHNLVRNAEGQKMSKSKGTGVDPMELNDLHGTDAMRFALAILAAPGTDIILSEDRILSSRAFANKIWNAARFLFFNLQKVEAPGITLEAVAAPDIRAASPYGPAGTRSLVDRWIFSRLAAVSAQVNEALENFRFHEASHLVYHFFWGEFCDWYIEWVKPQLNSSDRETALAAWRNIIAVFDASLRLLHPFMPFLTEELWHQLPQRTGAKTIALERFPEPVSAWRDLEAERHMLKIQGGIISARNQRAAAKLDPKRKVPAQILALSETERNLIESNMEAIMRLGALSEISIKAAHSVSSSADLDVQVQLDEVIDHHAEIARLRKKTERLAKDLESKQGRLADQTFRSRAPADVVSDMENTLRERRAEYQKLVERLAQLEKTSGAAAL